MVNAVGQLKKDLRTISSPEKAKESSRFFKTQKGQYGFGDKFLGVTMPMQRAIAKKFKDLGFEEIEILLGSEFHEERSVALIILVQQYIHGDDNAKKNIFDFYIKHIKSVNNWDLVDGSASNIIGNYILDKKITLLLAYAKNQDLWIRRIAIIATFAFTYNGNSKPTFLVADLLLDDREDLIQKAVGWMLRETGKRISKDELEAYLKPRYKKMGRTALRYAIEHFDTVKRKKYLQGVI